jgi:hypothetical protein
MLFWLATLLFMSMNLASIGCPSLVSKSHTNVIKLILDTNKIT